MYVVSHILAWNLTFWSRIPGSFLPLDKCFRFEPWGWFDRGRYYSVRNDKFFKKGKFLQFEVSNTDCIWPRLWRVQSRKRVQKRPRLRRVRRRKRVQWRPCLQRVQRQKQFKSIRKVEGWSNSWKMTTPLQSSKTKASSMMTTPSKSSKTKASSMTTTPLKSSKMKKIQVDPESWRLVEQFEDDHPFEEFEA